jgi:hypothetical protein
LKPINYKQTNKAQVNYLFQQTPLVLSLNQSQSITMRPFVHVNGAKAAVNLSKEGVRGIFVVSPSS